MASARGERRLFSSQAGIGFGPLISLAILRRFWAAAARWNSSRALHGPRNLRRSSFRMRLRCANSISTFLRSRLETSQASVFERSRARSRAPSWIERGTRRCGSLGQQRGFNAQALQSYLLAIVKRRSAVHGRAAGVHRLAARTADDVAHGVVAELVAVERSVIARRPVEHGDVRLDALLVHQPGEHLR